MDSHEWSASRPSAEGYDLVVLDLFFGPPTTEGFHKLPGDDAHFYELGEEAAKSLQSGGVVIALLGPVAVTSRNLLASYAKEVVRIKQDELWQYERKYTGNEETSYEWLDLGFLSITKVDAVFAKESEGITPIAGTSTLNTYVSNWAKKYWVTVNGIGFIDESTNVGIITHGVAQVERWGVSSVAQYPVKVLAVGKHTKLPVAVAMRYMGWEGILILLPHCTLREKTQPAGNEEMGRLLRTLESLAKSIKEDFVVSGAFDHAGWVYEYRSTQAKTIVSQIENTELQEKELAEELQLHDRMLVLIDGTGEPLVDGVASLFDKPTEGIKVKRTEKGAPIDLFIQDSKGRQLVVEITGITGNLKKDDPHWADFLGYMPEHNARNEHGRIERIVLVVNTQCKTKPSDRNRQNDISAPVRSTVADNHICVIRSCDLYELWLETLQGKSLQEIFDLLFDNEGVWKP